MFSPTLVVNNEIENSQIKKIKETDNYIPVQHSYLRVLVIYKLK